MISIIVSSISKTFLENFSKNVANTVGLEYEIISVDTTINQFGLCHAYNQGAGKSKFQYLCFIHEDVKFVTENWGKKLINHFNSDEEIGLLGIAGSVCKTKMSSMWHQSPLQNSEANRVNVIQHYKH